MTSWSMSIDDPEGSDGSAFNWIPQSLKAIMANLETKSGHESSFFFVTRLRIRILTRSDPGVCATLLTVRVIHSRITSLLSIPSGISSHTDTALASVASCLIVPMTAAWADRVSGDP